MEEKKSLLQLRHRELLEKGVALLNLSFGSVNKKQEQVPRILKHFEL